MRFREHRNWLAAGLALVAVVEIGVLGLRAAGVEGRTRVGPVLLSLHSVSKPLWIALGTSVALLAVAAGLRLWRACAFALMIAAVAVAIVALARGAPPIVTKADIAVTELYVQLAAEGHLLEGPYSRFGWHHPGPLYFWLQVPVYELSGGRGTGLYAGALALNLMALAVLAAVLLRANHAALTVSMLAGWLLFAWRDRFTVASPWTGHIPVLPTITFVVLAAAVASGRRWMLVPLVFFGSLMTQSHVALVPLVIVVSAAAVAGLRAVHHHQQQTRLTPALQTSAWLLALLWLPVIAEQMAHEPGNLARLWHFFVGTGHPGKSWGTAFTAWSYALVGALRPDLYTPYGGHFEMTHLGWGIPVALAEVVILAILGVKALRDRFRFDGALAVMALVASSVALWSITRVQGDIVDHEIFWISSLGAVNLGIIAAAALRQAGSLWPAASAHVARVAAAVLLLGCVYTGFRDFDRLIAYETNRPMDRVIAATYDSVQRYLASSGVQKPLFRIAGVWDVAAAVLLRLHASGAAFSVEDSAIVMFTEAFSAHGDEDGVITIGGRDPAPPHGNRSSATVVQEEPVYVEAHRIQP